jgi:hypothetical protein
MYKGYQVKQGLTTFVQKLSALYGKGSFRVEFRGTGAATDISTVVYLPHIADDENVTKVTFNRYLGYILHEVAGHVVNTENQFIRNIYKHQLWNALEDGWIEGRIIASGDIPNSESLLTRLVNDIYAEAFEADINWADPRQWPFALAVWARKYVHLRPPVPAPVAAIFDEAVSKPAKSSEGNLNVALWVYDQLDKYLSENEKPDEPRDDSDGSGDSGDDSGDSGDGDSGDGDSGDGESGDDSGNVPEGYGKGLHRVTDPTAVEPTPDARIESVNERARRECKDIHNQIREPFISEEVPVSKNDQPNENRRRAEGKLNYPRIKTPARLRYELNRLFEGSAREQWNNGHRAGQINAGALARHSFDDGVFRRRQEEEGVDTALSIIIDTSGSTDNYKGHEITIGQAEFATVEAIYDALRGTNVSIETYAYATKTTRITHFGEGVSVFRSRAEEAWLTSGWDNNDLEPLLFAHRSLLARPEKRKIVLYLTDGGSEVRKEVFNQCVIGQNLGITTIGVGIFVKLGKDGHIPAMFPQHIYISDLADLASASFKQIKLAA